MARIEMFGRIPRERTPSKLCIGLDFGASHIRSSETFFSDLTVGWLSAPHYNSRMTRESAMPLIHATAVSYRGRGVLPFSSRGSFFHTTKKSSTMYAAHRAKIWISTATNKRATIEVAIVVRNEWFPGDGAPWPKIVGKKIRVFSFCIILVLYLGHVLLFFIRCKVPVFFFLQFGFFSGRSLKLPNWGTTSEKSGAHVCLITRVFSITNIDFSRRFWG